jgi:hypothetical protein
MEKKKTMTEKMWREGEEENVSLRSCSVGPPLAAVVQDNDVGGPEHPLIAC